MAKQKKIEPLAGEELIRKVNEQGDEKNISNGETTFEEILAPVHQQVKISGVTEEELENLFESAREEVWQEKKRSNSM